jgi:hypothetical protein
MVTEDVGIASGALDEDKIERIDAPFRHPAAIQAVHRGKALCQSGFFSSGIIPR